jgi:hypothetical protein
MATLPPSTVAGVSSSRSTGTPSAPPNAVTPIEATIALVPDKIQQLLRQIQVNGTVSTPPNAGTITLSTVLGNLTITLPKLADAAQQAMLQQLNALFESQRPISVVVQPGDPPTQAFLLLPPLTTQTQKSIPTETSLPLATMAPVPVTIGTTLSALVLPPLSSPPAPGGMPVLPALGSGPFMVSEGLPPNLAAALVGTDLPPDLSAALVSAELNAKPQITPLEIPPELAAPLLPESAPQSQPVSAQAPEVATSLPPLTGMPFQSPAVAAPVQLTLEALLQPGNTVELQLAVIIPPPLPQTAATLPPQPGPNQILVTVTGNGPNGQLILQAADVTLYVKQNAALPVGSQILVTVTAGKSDLAAPLMIPDIQNFTSLQQVFSALTQLSPPLAQQLLAHIPQSNTTMSGAMLFMLSAFKQGNVREWLGEDTVEMLTSAGKFNLITKLTDELTQAGQTGRDSIVGEWRAYPLPIHNNNQLRAAIRIQRVGAHKT